jgi:hypothetical protein
MAGNSIAGYLWVTLGLFFLIFFGGRLFLQLLGVIIGFICIFKGLRLFALDNMIYKYSMHYFDNKFKK